MQELKANGGTITPNPLSPNQEVNLTIKSIEKMDFRIETHVVLFVSKHMLFQQSMEVMD